MSPRPLLVAASPVSRALLRTARRYAHVASTILITGETGAGKDALARYIHHIGPRRREPFVVVDCPAIPATLLEAELFGHERGAFTDAAVARSGRFEVAGGGTVYLDAVTGLALPSQGALLRVIEERQLTRLGGTRPIALRARVIASADAAIVKHVAAGAFRTDLFHRLCVLTLHVPPLRDRRDDILPIANTFLRDLAVASGRDVPALSPDAADALVQHNWPGNVRELHHVLERALISSEARLRAQDLVFTHPGDASARREHRQPFPTLEQLERQYIADILQRTGGNQTVAAAILGISRKALWEKRKRFGWQ